jgi:hypothetical protein
MERIFRIGVADGMPEYLKERIVITNKMALVMTLMGTIFAIFSMVAYPELAVYSVLSAAVCLATFALNHIGAFDVSRFILSVITMIQASVYHGFLVQGEEPMIASMMVAQIALTVVPWVLIDFREKVLLISSLAVCFAIFFSQGFLNDMLKPDLDGTMFREGFMTPVTYLFGTGVLIVCLAFMQHNHWLAAQRNNRLIDEIKQQSTEMEQQQDALKQSLQELNKAHADDEKRTWIANGLSEMNDILRNSDSGDMYKKLVKGLVKYLDIVQAGIYLEKEAEEGEKYLYLEACYAFDRIKHINQRIEIGQGLVGQCYLEKEKIVLKEIPQGYVNITSGLGDAPPQYVLIMPIKNEDNLRGILEMASFRELEAHKIQFLEKLGETLTVFISNNVINEQTRQLLEQSQLQTEQLRAQEEEMRQNMEEMQATQEEMHRKEKEYIDRIAELEKQAQPA